MMIYWPALAIAIAAIAVVICVTFKWRRESLRYEY